MWAVKFFNQELVMAKGNKHLTKYASTQKSINQDTQSKRKLRKKKAPNEKRHLITTV